MLKTKKDLALAKIYWLMIFQIIDRLEKLANLDKIISEKKLKKIKKLYE